MPLTELRYGTRILPPKAQRGTVEQDSGQTDNPRQTLLPKMGSPFCRNIKYSVALVSGYSCMEKASIMTGDISTARPKRDEPIIRIPAIGLTVRVRFAHQPGNADLTIVETTNAPRLGPPMYRRAEVEIFEVVSGRYLFQVDDSVFIAKRGDLVRVPGGAARAFVNLASTGARQKVIFHPGIDASSYFNEFAQALKVGSHPSEPLASSNVDQARTRLEEFGKRWGITFLDAPLKPIDDSDWPRPAPLFPKRIPSENTR